MHNVPMVFAAEFLESAETVLAARSRLATVMNYDTGKTLDEELDWPV